LVWLRACITNHRTTDDDVRAVAEEVLTAAEDTAFEIRQSRVCATHQVVPWFGDSIRAQR
jgi:hypothetical protein